MSEPNDHEWILLRERGEDVSHIPASKRAKYDALARLFEALPGATPSPGWKQRILAALDEPPGPDPAFSEPSVQDVVATAPDGPPVRDISTARRHRTRRRFWIVAGGLAATLAIAFVIVPRQHDTDAPRPSVPVVAKLPERHIQIPAHVVEDRAFTTEVRRSDTPHRSGSVSIGDILVVHVNVAPPFELRVYGDTGEPLARCTETQGCSLENDGNVRRFRLELELRASGDVRAVLFTGASIPVAFQDLNADVEAAQKANVEARQVKAIHVQ